MYHWVLNEGDKGGQGGNRRVIGNEGLAQEGKEGKRQGEEIKKRKKERKMKKKTSLLSSLSLSSSSRCRRRFRSLCRCLLIQSAAGYQSRITRLFPKSQRGGDDGDEENDAAAANEEERGSEEVEGRKGGVGWEAETCCSRSRARDSDKWFQKEGEDVK